MSPIDTAISVIEVRRAKNGYVISAITGTPFGDSSRAIRGYATYVVESEDPKAVGRAVEQAITDFAITSDVPIPPARQLP